MRCGLPTRDGPACALDSGHKGRCRIQRPSAAPWTEAHRREALRRTYEIAAEVVATGDVKSASWFAYVGACGADRMGFTDTEQTWRRALTAADGAEDMIGLDAARIEREVRRVRGLAEGRLVREHSERWEVVFAEGGREGPWPRGEEAARERAADFEGARPVRVRVTRIRRAP